MQRADQGARILPSILDRLLDDVADVSHEPLADRFQNLLQLKRVVTRDLETLLNTRQEVWEELPSEFTERHHSLLVYGLLDFTVFSLLNPHDSTRIRRSVGQATALFELRLSPGCITLEAPLRSQPVAGSPCRFRTCYPVTLRPVEVTAARIEAADRQRRSVDAVAGIAQRYTEVESGTRNVDHILIRTLLPEIFRDFLAHMAEGQRITKVHVSGYADGAFQYEIA